MMDVYKFYDTLDDIILSLLIIAAAIYLCNLARILRSSILSYTGYNSSDFGKAFTEMIGTMESSVIGFELNFIIYDLYGPTVYAVAVFFSLMWQTKRNNSFKYWANPAVVAMKHVKTIRGGMASGGDWGSYLFVAKIIGGELAGAALAYYFIVYVAWGNADQFTIWRSSNYHMSRYSSRNSWKSSLHTSVFNGMGVEGLFSFLNYMVPSLISHHTDFGSGSAGVLAVNAAKAIFCGIGSEYTGAYYNPIVATALEYTTRGHSLRAKAQVYWLAPAVGVTTAMLIA